MVQMKREKEIQMELIYVWQIKHKWIMEARKFMFSAGKKEKKTSIKSIRISIS